MSLMERRSFNSLSRWPRKPASTHRGPAVRCLNVRWNIYSQNGAITLLGYNRWVGVWFSYIYNGYLLLVTISNPSHFTEQLVGFLITFVIAVCFFMVLETDQW